MERGRAGGVGDGGGRNGLDVNMSLECVIYTKCAL